MNTLRSRQIYLSLAMILLVLVLSMTFSSSAFAQGDPGAPSGDGVTPEFVAGNPNCSDLGYGFGFKINNSPNGTFTLTNPPGELTGGAPSDPNNSVTISNSDGTFFDWSATLGIDAVIVKGGPNADTYVYVPEDADDTQLHPPVNPNNGQYYGISHIEFCYDYEVTVTKDAHTSYTRTYDWTIEKGPDANYEGFAGDSWQHTYTIAVNQSGYTDSDWAVSGSIVIENNTPFAATITGVSDMLGGIGPISVDCGVTFPYSLLSESALTCSYKSSLPDGSDRVNTATVTTSGVVGGGSDDVDVTFGAPTMEVNKEVNITDDYGTAAATGDDLTFGPFATDTTVTYDRDFACPTDFSMYIDGVYTAEVVNTATIDETNQSDDATVTLTCYLLSVTKDAHTSLTRTYIWSIEKEGDQSSLTLSTGQIHNVNYVVTVSATYADSDWAVNGTIQVENSAPILATINSVTDIVSPDIAASVSCGVAFPTVLAPGTLLKCSYSADLPDGADRTNTATAVLQNSPSGTTSFSGSAAVSFADATITKIDSCIDVTDDKYGPLGMVCYDQLPKQFEYTLSVGPYDTCGHYTYVNTASFVTKNNGDTGESSWTVEINVPCEGCTLTQGYWKTHSINGPAPYDDTWAQIGEDTPFFQSGKSYYMVLWTSPAGNAYYNLAHQYIAAELNMLNGADAGAVQDEFDAATDLLSQYTPDYVAGLKGNNPIRKEFIALASILDNYNSGAVGPGHCSESLASASVVGANVNLFLPVIISH